MGTAYSHRSKCRIFICTLHCDSLLRWLRYAGGALLLLPGRGTSDCPRIATYKSYMSGIRSNATSRVCMYGPCPVEKILVHEVSHSHNPRKAPGKVAERWPPARSCDATPSGARDRVESHEPASRNVGYLIINRQLAEM